MGKITLHTVTTPVKEQPQVKPPKVIVAEQAIQDMISEARDHSVETAWGVYGFILPDNEVFVSGIIPPSRKDVKRKYDHAALGGEHQTEVFDWLFENARLMKRRGINPPEARFTYLYKGHSHHNLSCFYSGTDQSSILDTVKNGKQEVAIGPLVAFENVRHSRPQSQKGSLIVPEEVTRVKFYCLTKQMVEAKIYHPTAVDVHVVSGLEGITSPPIGWQFTREEEFNQQIKLLKRHGCTVDVFTREIDNTPPLRIQFLVKKPGWKGLLSITTQHNYPATDAEFTVTPFKAEEPEDTSISQSLWNTVHRGPVWKRGMNFVDAVKTLERTGKL